MKIKVIKNHRILPFFYDKRGYKQAFALSMFGAFGCIVFLIKFVCSLFFDNIEFTKDEFIGLGASVFILTMFLNSALILYMSSILVEIVESIVNDNEFEHKSLSENK